MFSWLRKMWHWLVDWLTKPIAFPGMWDINERLSKRYNKEESILDPYRDLNER
jgi:hypothetical protein